MGTKYRKLLWVASSVICLLSAQTVFAGTADSGACTGNNILFYNSHNGAALTGKISTSGLSTFATFPAGSFSTGWSQVSHIDTGDAILFYSANNGTAAEGTLNNGVYMNAENLSGLTLGWTDIQYVGLQDNSVPLPLFYNASLASGAVGFNPSERIFPSGSFTAGWSHIIWDGGPNMLFYNSANGAAAVAVDAAAPGNSNDVNNLTTTKVFPAGSFGHWSHLTMIGNEIFFYNNANGSAAIGRMTPSSGANNFVTDQGYPANYFGPQWTHVVGMGNNLSVFYNSANGGGAVVQMVLPGTKFPLSQGFQFQTVAVIPSSQIPAGFTHVVCSQDVQNQIH